jgi:hypothetical protein
MLQQGTSSMLLLEEIAVSTIQLNRLAFARIPCQMEVANGEILFET